jgi:hypothetical protein
MCRVLTRCPYLSWCLSVGFSNFAHGHVVQEIPTAEAGVGHHSDVMFSAEGPQSCLREAGMHFNLHTIQRFTGIAGTILAGFRFGPLSVNSVPDDRCTAADPLHGIIRACRVLH